MRNHRLLLSLLKIPEGTGTGPGWAELNSARDAASLSQPGCPWLSSADAFPGLPICFCPYSIIFVG